MIRSGELQPVFIGGSSGSCVFGESFVRQTEKPLSPRAFFVNGTYNTGLSVQGCVAVDGWANPGIPADGGRSSRGDCRHGRTKAGVFPELRGDR